MSEHRRTAIRRLSVRRYRSVEEVVLEDLPDVIVLYGPNGAGKSNILRAAQLVLRAAALPGVLPMAQAEAVSVALSEANRSLDLRPDDFRFGDVPEIRVSLAIDLGTRAREIVLPSSGRELSRLELEAVFQLPGDGSLRFWFERAHVDGDFALGGDQLRNDTTLGDPFLAERVQRSLIPRLLQVSAAYRVPGGDEDPQKALYRSLLSEDARERDAAQRLGERLARAGLHGELPLRNLGSGEQQVVLMLAQRVITPYPIAHVEEPEAHLDTSLMEPLARVLRGSVLGDGGSPDVDQLWMATHHHLFAIAEEFFDVSLDNKGATRVERKKRDEAAKHFYEPLPYWDTLRGLVASGMSPDTIVSIDGEGQPIRAQAVLDSIHGDRRLANAFVEAATRAFVLSLAQDEPARRSVSGSTRASCP